MTDSPTPPPRSTMRLDIVTAYLASAAKVVSWALVSRVVFLEGDASQFALLALIRSTIGVLSYATLGLGPAMIRMLAQARSVKALNSDALENAGDITRPGATLSYARPMPKPGPPPPDAIITVYVHGLALCVVLATIACIAVNWYADHFDLFHRIPAHPQYWKIQFAVANMGIGLAFRLFSDAPGALMQVRGKMWLDNLLIASADIGWAVLCWSGVPESSLTLTAVTDAYARTGVLLILARVLAALFLNPLFRWYRPPWRLTIVTGLLAYGSVVTIGQLADFLYAPVDFILINRLIDPIAGAVYAPAVQIDAGLLMLVSGLAAVILPKAAIAHSNEDHGLLRHYYVRGTFTSLGLLVPAALMVWLISSRLFRVWLGDPMPATRAILPLVLIHTVVGGSSAVGRSILLGMGKVKPFTISVLIAGVSNVILSYIFVRYLGLGLTGIILGTIVAVVGRCAVWMPWYVLKCLRQTENFSPETIPK